MMQILLSMLNLLLPQHSINSAEATIEIVAVHIVLGSVAGFQDVITATIVAFMAIGDIIYALVALMALIDVISRAKVLSIALIESHEISSLDISSGRQEKVLIGLG